VSIPICRDCGVALGQQAEKALSGEVQMVWADLLTGEWVCPKTGDEHVQVMGGALPDEAPDTVGYEQVAHMIQDLRTELEDRIETLQREVEELRDRLD
jgi:hypothetical protein